MYRSNPDPRIQQALRTYEASPTLENRWRYYQLRRQVRRPEDILESRSLNIKNVYNLSFSFDGRYLAVGAEIIEAETQVEVLYIISLESNEIIFEEFFHLIHPINSLTFFDKNKLGIASGNSLKTYEINHNNITERILNEYEHPIRAIASNGVHLAVGGKTAQVINPRTGEIIYERKHIGLINSVAISKRCLAVGSNRFARVIDFKTGKPVFEYKHEDYVYSIAISQNSKYLATGLATSYDENSVKIFDLETGKSILLPIPAAEYSLVFSPDGEYLIVGSSYPFKDHPNLSQLFSLKDKTFVLTKAHNPATVKAVNFSPNGLEWAYATDEQIFIYEAP